ncbi:hypothetical protein AAHH18_14630, partial [Cellulomonas sp. P4]
MSVVVPPAVRAAVVGLAAEVLGALEPATVPSALAAVRRFAPRRRADAGAGPLWRAVEGDDAFRARVARAWSHAHPDEAADLLAAGREPSPRPSPSPSQPAGPGAPVADLDAGTPSSVLDPDAGTRPSVPDLDAGTPSSVPDLDAGTRPSVLDPDAGTRPSAPDPVTLAVGAVLLRPPGWQD